MTQTDDLKIPGYEITGELGSGGMATVYLAIQKSFNREVALKVMSPQLSSDKSFGERFIREAHIVAQMRHNNIVSVYDVGEHEKSHYLSMELLPGGDVKKKLEKEAGPALAYTITTHIASALHYAHAKGYLHRDIKPENIMYREDGTPVLTDFGIARAVDSGSTMTKTGTMIGTPSYMSPEQASGSELDNRSDIYALGIVFIELLTGSVPYKADSAVALALKHINETVPELPLEYSAYQPFIDKALAKDRNERFSSCEELIVALQQIGIQQDSEKTIILPRATSQFSATTPIPTASLVAGTVAGTVSSAPFSPTTDKKEEEKHPATRKLIPIIASGVFIGLLAIGGVYYLFQKTDSSVPEPGSHIASEETESPRATKWLDKAKNHENANEPEQALRAYFGVLSFDKNNKKAKDGVSRLTKHFLINAKEAFQRNKLTLAQNHLLNVFTVAPDNEEATQLLAKIKQQLNTSENVERIEQLLSLAEQAVKNKQLAKPESANAFFYYKNILELKPSNSKAQEGLSHLAGLFLLRADTFINETKLKEANEQIQLAIDADPNHTDIQSKLDRLGKAISLREETGKPSLAEQQQKVTHTELAKIKPQHDTPKKELDDQAQQRKANTSVSAKKKLTSQKKMDKRIREALTFASKGSQIISQEQLNVDKLRSAHSYYLKANKLAKDLIEVRRLRHELIATNEKLASHELSQKEYASAIEIIDLAQKNKLNSTSIDELGKKAKTLKEAAEKKSKRMNKAASFPAF